MEFSQILQESKTVQAHDFIALVDEVIEILSGEEKYAGNVTVTDKLVMLQPKGKALVIGDLHGDLDSLTTILEQSHLFPKISQQDDEVAVFLGDYGDRGFYSPELYYAVLSLKRYYPKCVVLLRGNHEGPGDLMASPHDLPIYLQRKFKEEWVGVYQRIRELFEYLYNAVYVDERYLMVHAGLPQKVRSLQEIAHAHKLHPEKPFLEELLWNDPDENVRGVFPSARGAGNLFGKSVTEEVLATLKAKILIRGHESARDGFKVNHDGKILTLFSRKGPPYNNSHGAYLQLPLEERFENANQLMPYIYKF